MYGGKQIQSNEKKKKIGIRTELWEITRKKKNSHKEKHLKMNALLMYALTDAVYQ